MVRIAAIAFAAAVSSLTPAEAGGVFGCSGSKSLFRGSVGCALAPVQKQAITPMVRKGVEDGAAAGGAYLGGLVGAPQLGAVAGRMVGQEINARAAGGGPAAPVGSSAPIQPPMPAPMPMQTPAPLPVQMSAPASHSYCATPVGLSAPLPIAPPPGSPCRMMTPMGPVHGRVVM